MKKIVIVGGGFAGISALDIFFRSKADIDLILIDKKKTSDFLPLLPDCIGRGINPDFLSSQINTLINRRGFNYVNEEVLAIDLDKKEILTPLRRLSYDYVIIASGSETNFYGNENIRQNSFALDSVEDVKLIIDALRRSTLNAYLVAGGGYTGIELATNLRIYLNKADSNSRVFIVERASTILGPLPEWMKLYVVENLKKLNIEVLTNTTIENVDKNQVRITGGRVFDNAFLIWAAGVKTAGFIQNLKVDKNPQGRIKVDDYLRLNDSCFVCGDAAYVSCKNIFLRMAVQFALTQGACAADNIIRDIKGKCLCKYQARDLGYIIPMANNRGCGMVFGFNVKGFPPILLHFLMCIYRSCGIKNKLGIIRDLQRR